MDNGFTKEYVYEKSSPELHLGLDTTDCLLVRVEGTLAILSPKHPGTGDAEVDGLLGGKRKKVDRITCMKPLTT